MNIVGREDGVGGPDINMYELPSIVQARSGGIDHSSTKWS
jgi:hypothetical protein